ncbi:MAG: hypothetical protein DBX55_08225 [Verrucomicrobia bacterium]|nr:MAG: hypothetical protein DBX55_08225 [Verrucomicrobiota bacterium]
MGDYFYPQSILCGPSLKTQRLFPQEAAFEKFQTEIKTKAQRRAAMFAKKILRARNFCAGAQGGKRQNLSKRDKNSPTCRRHKFGRFPPS